MIWKKRKVTTAIWEANGFKIVQDLDGEDKPFRLQSPVSDDEWFGNLEQAKKSAELQNKLALAEKDNARLRAELGERAGRWPTPEEAAPEPTEADAGEFEEEEDGRGIPAGPALHQPLTA